MKPLVYLSAPYNTPPYTFDQRERMITKDTAVIMQLGRAHVFSPITHNHPINQSWGNNPGYGFWLEYDEKMVSVCDELWVLMHENWEASRGVKFEIELAQRLGKPVRYVKNPYDEPTDQP